MYAILIAVALAAIEGDDPLREPEPDLVPCPPPRPGEIYSGPCSPTPERPPDPSQPGARPPPTRPEIWPSLDDDEETEGWLDLRHGLVEEQLTLFVHRLDGFFGDPTHIHLDPPRSWIRVRSEVRTGQDEAFDPGFSLVADVRLPALDRLLKRARIFVSGGEDDAAFQTGTEQDLVPRRFSPSLRSTRGAAELRFDVYRAPRTVVDVGGGARFRLPVPPYLRARAAHAVPLALGVVAHGNQTVFWEGGSGSGFGESSRIDVERVFTRRTIARVWGIATLHERSRGLEWGAETGLQQGLGRRTGVYLAGALEGATRANVNVDRYRVFTRFRRDIHDAWLYLEVEPEVSWPADAVTGDRDRVLATTVRLEVQFVTSRP